MGVVSVDFFSGFCLFVFVFVVFIFIFFFYGGGGVVVGGVNILIDFKGGGG